MVPPAFGTEGYFGMKGEWGRGGGAGGGGVDRRPSHRSMGGVFDISPLTGGYVRDGDGERDREMERGQEMRQVYWNGSSYVGNGRDAVVALNQGRPVEMG